MHKQSGHLDSRKAAAADSTKQMRAEMDWDEVAGDLQDLMTAPQEQSEPTYMDAMPLAPGPDALPETTPDAGFSEDAAAKYDAVMAFCLTKGQVLFTTLMTQFVNIHLGDLERYNLQRPYKTSSSYTVV